MIQKNGGKFTSKINGASIFLPASGDYDSQGRHDWNAVGCCWLSTPRSSPDYEAYAIHYGAYSTNDIRGYSRYMGIPVRPVIKK